MEISGPLNLSASMTRSATVSHETNRYYTPPRLDQMPRTFAAATSAHGTTKLIQNLGAIPPPAQRDAWKVTREFEETFQAYKQSTINELDAGGNTTHQNLGQFQSYDTPERRTDNSENMAQQRETVSIGFDPNQTSQNGRSIGSAERSASIGVAQTNETRNFRSTLDDQKAQVNHAVTEFYAPQQEEYDGMYTLAPDEDEAGATTHNNWDEQEFERPRAVPYDHRETRLVVKEDIDFFMAMLGAKEPPPPTQETQHYLVEETEAKRRSQEVLEREASQRKEDELLTTQTDLEFWNMLMKAS